MAVDIAPELYEEIQRRFEQNIERNKRIQNFQRKDKHNAKEVSLYSAELGKCASDALVAVLTEENLPDGKLYWNIAKRTILPLLRTAYNMVMAAAEETQKQEDEKLGISINPIKPAFSEERARGLINKLIEHQESETDEE